MPPDVYKQLIWDYQISPSEFDLILSGQKTFGSLNQAWAISRILENLNYYDAIKMVSLDSIKNNWLEVKPKLFKKAIKDGYEFVLQRHALSHTG